MNWLMQTEDDVGPLLARLALAIAIFPHGAQKLLGWFGGSGYSATMAFYTDQMGLPAVIVFLLIVIEFFAPIALVLGLLTRLASLGIGAVMVGAVATVHYQYGFFMNWAGQKAGEGFEYHILALGLVLILLVKGAGRVSLDRLSPSAV